MFLLSVTSAVAVVGFRSFSRRLLLVPLLHFTSPLHLSAVLPCAPLPSVCPPLARASSLSQCADRDGGPAASQRCKRPRSPIPLLCSLCTLTAVAHLIRATEYCRAWNGGGSRQAGSTACDAGSAGGTCLRRSGAGRSLVQARGSIGSHSLTPVRPHTVRGSYHVPRR